MTYIRWKLHLLHWVLAASMVGVCCIGLGLCGLDTVDRASAVPRQIVVQDGYATRNLLAPQYFLRTASGIVRTDAPGFTLARTGGTFCGRIGRDDPLTGAAPRMYDLDTCLGR